MMDAREIKELDKKVNSFIVLDEEGSLRKDAAKKGALAGLTVAVKSNMCVEGMLTTAASKTLENYVAPYDATVVGKIKQAGS